VHEVKVLLGVDGPGGVVPTGLMSVADVVNVPPRGERHVGLLHEIGAEGAEVGVLVGLDSASIDPVEVLSRDVAAMVQAVRDAGSRLAQVKLCGALSRICEERSIAAEACVDWMYAEAEGIYLVVPAGGLLHAVAEARGVPLRREIVADRLYASEAKLASGDADEDVSATVGRIRDWKATERLRLAEGGEWLVEAELVSVSADGPGCLTLASEIRKVLD
jgi:lactam utilization protein B